MKKALSDKYLTIRIPTPLMEKFQEVCRKKYKTMSEALRDMIQEYIKKGE